MKRVFLFIATNIAIIFVLSIVLRLLGVDHILDEQGVNLDMKALLVFAAVFGMGGSFLSLAISKWTAKRMTGALERLSGGVNQPHLPDQMAALGISGGIGQGMKRLFMTHPPMEERIAALRARA